MARLLRRAGRAARAWLIYRLDQLLTYPPLVQVAALLLLTAILIAGFAFLARLTFPQEPSLPDATEALWWSVTHFLDGGTMATDPMPMRLLALGATCAGILAVSLLTAALASKMGERIADMRSGLNPVVERDHVLCLGYDPNVALVAREIARSGQRCTLVVLAPEDKDRIDAALRPARQVPRHRLRTVVRTGDPRNEQALLRVAAQNARAIIVMPPANLSDDDSVQWTLSTLLAMRRVAEEGFGGRVIVEARHTEARELLSLAGEPGVAGPGQLALDIVASDEVVASILAASTRQDGIYFVLRHLLAFDGCEFYVEPVPEALAGRTFDEAHAVVRDAILVGVSTEDGELLLSPAPSSQRRLERADRLILLAPGRNRWRAGGELPPPLLPEHSAMPDPAPQNVSVVGFNSTLPHLLKELSVSLPQGSRVQVVAGDNSPRALMVVENVRTEVDSVQLSCDTRPAAPLMHRGQHEMCRADAVVILGNEDPQDENGDASALAMLLRLRHGQKVSGHRARRVVTEVRDPRSAVHIAPRRGDAVVSSDVVAMLLAQVVLDPDVAPVYREMLSLRGVAVRLGPRHAYVTASPSTFAQVQANARARGEVALGFYPDPRGQERSLARQRLEEGDVELGEDAWLNPPRDTPVPDTEDTQVVVLAPLPHGRASGC
ncbi:CASTOR/POLLUX-related putative ion channel [Hyalangium versicolor]|uniref:CASTOR/POLLUX-related putative ion channel n=1 Tax=Hyalangium versicolor TaxID=2861190 RepID=UPI001CCEFC6C|nr:hypothetical protein [Hyalangium versicolor]